MPAPDTSPEGSTAWERGRRRLSHGMAIDAAIEARLLGKRLLTLNAKITALPATTVRMPMRRATETRVQSEVTAVVKRPSTAGRPRLHPMNGEVSGGLAEAAKALAAGAAELQAARARMPIDPG